MGSPRERDHRGSTRLLAAPPSSVQRPIVIRDPGAGRRPVHVPQPVVPHHPVRVPPPVHHGHHGHHGHHHFHDEAPWPQQQYGDYVLIQGWGWWPRWYPYWDRRWYDYWWSLYDYYGGDSYPDYAAYARDAFLRANAQQLGIGLGSPYGQPYVGSAAQGAAALQRYAGVPDQTLARRRSATERAIALCAATGHPLVGYRDTPWGSETILFGSPLGLHRWSREQAADGEVWYAATFDLGTTMSPLSEVSRG